MICKPCRTERHASCPETARKHNPALTDTEKTGSPWCDCAHKRPVPGEGRAPTLVK